VPIPPKPGAHSPGGRWPKWGSMGETSGIQLRVSDLKQYLYCPRVVYFQYVLPVDHSVTYKMEKGKVAQEEIEVLEARRKLKKYGLKEGKRVFNPWLSSRKHGLTGKLDLLIETDDGLFPVDFKYTRGQPYQNHVYQLGGYGLLLEEYSAKPARKGFVYLIPQKDAVVFDLTEELREECVATLDRIKEMIREERFPAPPAQRGKCLDCEYQNYCRDIW
jgi:CRISPR-associated exonuclease Cas4